MQFRSLSMAAVLLALVAPSAAAQARDPAPVSAQGTTQKPGLVEARKFVTDAAQGGMAEVRKARLATQRSADPVVRQFAQHMIDGHTQANQALMQVAQQSGIEPPTGLGKDQQQALDRLQKLSGAEFDRAYMAAQVRDHQEMIELFQEQANQANVPAIQQYAQRTLPKLREHLNQAERIETSVKTSAGPLDERRVPSARRAYPLQ